MRSAPAWSTKGLPFCTVNVIPGLPPAASSLLVVALCASLLQSFVEDGQLPEPMVLDM
jgi:hypothetical protein